MKLAIFPLRRRIIPTGRNYRNKFSVFLVCVAISFFMWSLIKLSRVYDAPLKYTVNFQNLPKNKVLINTQDSIITLFVRARGLELYNKIFKSDKNQINIDLSGIRLSKNGEEYYGFVRTSKFLNDIADQLPQDNSLLGVEPDTLHLVFVQEHSRKVAVTADLSLSFGAQFQLYDSIKLIPDSVTLYGVKSLLDTIYTVKTEQRSLRNLKGSKLITLKLIQPKNSPLITLSNDSVTAEISVERFTEAKVDVLIGMVEGEKDKFRTFPEKVTLTCRVAMKEYERLDASLFSVAINHKEATASGNSLAEVYVTRQPTFAKVIRIEPAKVEFLLLQ